MSQEVARDPEASKPLAEQARLLTDPQPVDMTQSGNTIDFDPPSLTVSSAEQVNFQAAETLSGTLTVPHGMFTTSGSFNFRAGGSQLLTVLSPPTVRSINVGFGNANANGTITISSGTGNGDPDEVT